MVRNTPSDHPDFADLTKAKARIEEVATFVNEQKRVVENLAKVSDIIASITGLDIKVTLPFRENSKKIPSLNYFHLPEDF